MIPQTAPIFTFDPNEHRYFLDGVEIPGVTSILKSAGLTRSYGGFQDAQWRGLHVHQCTELYDLNDLDWNSVYPQWLGYVKAWARFRDDTGFNPTLIEWQGYDTGLRFAGTLDREGVLQGDVFQPDIKTGAEEPWHRFQTGGYWMLRAVKAARRGCVYLREDGTYKLVRHDDPKDMRVFLAALTIANVRSQMT